jgi:hypothetical protein
VLLLTSLHSGLRDHFAGRMGSRGQYVDMLKQLA